MASMIRVEYHSENGRAPWVVRYRGLWLAYRTPWRALKSLPRVWWFGRKLRRV